MRYFCRLNYFEEYGDNMYSMLKKQLLKKIKVLLMDYHVNSLHISTTT